MGVVDNYCKRHFRHHRIKSRESKLPSDEVSYPFPKIPAPKCTSILGKFLVGEIVLEANDRGELLQCLNQFEKLGLRSDFKTTVFRIGYKQYRRKYCIFSKNPYTLSEKSSVINAIDFLGSLPEQLKVQVRPAVPIKVHQKHFNAFLCESEPLYLGVFMERELVSTTWDLTYLNPDVIKLNLPESELSTSNLEGFVGVVYDTVVPVENPLSFTLRNAEPVDGFSTYIHYDVLLQALKKAASEYKNSVVAIYKLTVSPSPRLVYTCSLGEYSREVVTTTSY